MLHKLFLIEAKVSSLEKKIFKLAAFIWKRFQWKVHARFFIRRQIIKKLVAPIIIEIQLRFCNQLDDGIFLNENDPKIIKKITIKIILQLAN